MKNDNYFTLLNDSINVVHNLHGGIIEADCFFATLNGSNPSSALIMHIGNIIYIVKIAINTVLVVFIALQIEKLIFVSSESRFY